MNGFLTEIIIALIIITLLVILYFLPSIIANITHCRNEKNIKTLNMFFGWTGLGWVIALIWVIIENI